MSDRLRHLVVHLRRHGIAFAALVVALSFSPVASMAADLITTGQIANGAVTQPKLAADSVVSGKILNETIAGVDIKNGTVGSADLADGSVTTLDVKDGSINAPDIATNSVDGVLHIADGSIGANDIQDDSVDGLHVVDGSLGTDDIADGSIGADDLATSAQSAAYFSRNEFGPVLTTPDEKKIVGSLTVPAGSYQLAAALTGKLDGGTYASFRCALYTPAGVIVSERPATVSVEAVYAALPFQGLIQTDGGQITVKCERFVGSDVHVFETTISAVRVAATTGAVSTSR